MSTYKDVNDIEEEQTIEESVKKTIQITVDNNDNPTINHTSDLNQNEIIGILNVCLNYYLYNRVNGPILKQKIHNLFQSL